MKVFFLGLSLLIANSAHAAGREQLEMTIEKDGNVYQIRATSCGGLLGGSISSVAISLAQDSGMSGLTPISQLKIAPQSLKFDLALDYARVTIVNLPSFDSYRVVHTDGPASIEIGLYTTEKGANLGDLISVKTSQSSVQIDRILPTGLFRVFKKAYLDCISKSRNGELEAVKGTCIETRIQIPPGAPLKVYRDGRYVHRTGSAEINYADIQSLFSDWNSSAMFHLADFSESLARSGQRVSFDQLFSIFMAPDSDSQRVQILETLVKNLNSRIEMAQLSQVVSHLDSDSNRLRALEILRNYVQFDARDLSRILGQFDSDRSRVTLAGLFGARFDTPEFSGLTAANLVELLGELESDRSRLQLLDTQISRVPQIDGQALHDILALFDLDSAKVDAAAKLKDRVSLKASHLQELIAGLSLDSAKFELLTIFAPVVGVISAKEIKRLLAEFSLDSTKVSVVTLFAPKLEIAAYELQDLFSEFDRDSSIVTVVEIAGSRLAAFTSQDVISIWEKLELESSQVKILGLLASRMDEGQKSNLADYVYNNYQGGIRRQMTALLNAAN